ncbi:hypothetical protein JZU46_06335 [bacterium]|nr:hypothetical protein [bacterium]
MFKKTNVIAILSCILLLVSSSVVLAKGGGGGGGGGGGRSFSSGSSRSFSAPSKTYTAPSTAFKAAGATQAKTQAITTPTTPPKAVANAPSTNKTYFWSSKSADKPTVVAERKGFGGTSLYDKKQAQVIKQDKAVKAKEAMVADTNKYTVKPQVYDSKSALPKDVQSNPLYTQARVRSTDNYNTFVVNKTNYYTRHNFVPEPYMYTHSSYSGYNGIMFYMALNSMSNVAMLSTLYNHSGQPGYTQWREEANRQAETNADLKAKLAEMDAKLANMTGEKNPKYLPPDMPADVALANEALVVADKDDTKFILGTGIEKGNYCKAGHMLKDEAKGSIDVVVVNSEGTLNNLNLFAAGKIDGFIGQKDGIDSYSLINPELVDKMKARWVPLYKEPFHMIVNRDSNVKDITDLTEENTVYVGRKGSGSSNSWARIVAQSPEKYKNIKVLYMNEDIALKKVAESSKAVMLYVTGLNSGLVATAEKLTEAGTTKYKLVKITDESLLKIKDVDGLPLYSGITIPKNIYPNLQKGWFFKHKVPTIAGEAVLVVSDKWIAENGEEALADLSEAVTVMQPKIYEAVNGNL